MLALSGGACTHVQSCLLNMQDAQHTTVHIADESLMETSLEQQTDIQSDLEATGTESEPDAACETAGSQSETASEEANGVSTIPQVQHRNSVTPTPAMAAAISDTPRMWLGYKLVGDNVDKNIRPSFQRVDRRTQSLHYFNVYAVQDRVDFSMYSNEPQHTAAIPSSLMPSAEDVSAVTNDFVTLMSRCAFYILSHTDPFTHTLRMLMNLNDLYF